MMKKMSRRGSELLPLPCIRAGLTSFSYTLIFLTLVCFTIAFVTDPEKDVEKKV